MSTSVIIIEDEQLTANRLKKLIEDLSDLEVLTHLNSVKSAVEWLQQNQLPDIIFLDIHLGDGSGFDVLDAIPGFPLIIFTTAYDQYTLEAFHYNSVDYLLKPIKPKELVKAISKYERLKQQENSNFHIDRTRATLEKTYKSRFLFKVGSRYKQVSINDISYFFSHDGLNYARCTSGETYVSDFTMDQLEEVLDPVSFFRTNRGMMIGVDHIEEIHTYFNGRLLLELNPAYDHGDVLVSREKVKTFKNWCGL